MFGLRPSNGRGMVMATSFKRAYASKPSGSQDLYSLHGGVEGHGHILSQRIARRDKKAFLSNQSKETEENNRMGKTRELFKKIRDTKGTFNAKMGSIKKRNSMDLTEAEDIKKRWQEYTEDYTKKVLMTWNTTMLWSLT